ncbi:MAG TPA: hypothetical protein VK084_03780 [Chitinophagaceae bacterium]|nr:hypothetical protein [Chitinophagaceae bacterium]
MKWEKVRARFPNRCVLVEALNAKTHQGERLINDMAVISDFENGNDAWRAYKQTHAKDQSREFYIFHTNNTDIKNIEQPYLGVRRKI